MHLLVSLGAKWQNRSNDISLCRRPTRLYGSFSGIFRARGRRYSFTRGNEWGNECGVGAETVGESAAARSRMPAQRRRPRTASVTAAPPPAAHCDSSPAPHRILCRCVIYLYLPLFKTNSRTSTLNSMSWLHSLLSCFFDQLYYVRWRTVHQLKTIKWLNKF